MNKYLTRMLPMTDQNELVLTAEKQIQIDKTRGKILQ